MQEDADGWTPLHFAALVGWSEGIDILLRHHKLEVVKAARSLQVEEASRTSSAEVRRQHARLAVQDMSGGLQDGSSS